MNKTLFAGAQALTGALRRHPRRVASAIGALLLTAAGGALAVANLAPSVPQGPVHLVTEPVSPSESLQAQADALDAFSFTLYRS